MDGKTQTLAKKVYKLQNAIVRELNDAHIFLEQATPFLEEAKEAFARSESDTDRRYYVPSVGRTSVAERTDRELKAIYDGYLKDGLCKSFLVSVLSRFEAFLSDVLAAVLQTYPQKITIRVQDIPACPAVSPTEVFSAADKSQLVNQIIREHLVSVFRQRPKAYLAYACALIGCEEDVSFRDYFEIAATRDLIVHNDLIVNQLYIDKVGDRARGSPGDRLTVERPYFYDSLARMKKVSGAIKREVESRFGSQTKAAEAPKNKQP
ncbi:MAG TPA: hypothetical protein VHT03_07905 [Rhizomicrobium sp.]|nr:hypothetical protein [Rhizomicrobium sp.]